MFFQGRFVRGMPSIADGPGLGLRPGRKPSLHPNDERELRESNGKRESCSKIVAHHKTLTSAQPETWVRVQLKHNAVDTLQKHRY